MRRILFILCIFSGNLIFAAGIKTYYDYYETFNLESPTALSSYTGAYLFDFIPLDLDNIDTKMKLIISASQFVKQVGGDYGYDNDVQSSENIDLLKNFSVVWNHKKEFMPFLSYYTPYKSILNKNDEREITKKRDAVSIGIVSDLKKHQIGMSLDMLMSSYIDKQNDNGAEYIFRRGGFSGRMIVNLKMNKKSSMFISVASPVFWDFDIDDNPNGKEKSYFDKFQSSTGFNYKHKDLYAVYSFIFRNFEKYYDEDDGLQLSYPWITEHNFIFGYKIDKNLRLSVDYQLLPSVFTENMPEIGEEFRHTIGAFAAVEFENFIFNARYADSKLLSIESLGRVYFQMDLIYKLK